MLNAEKYHDWIESNVDISIARGNCHNFVVLMSLEFPELIVTKGHYICPISGPRPHWWLKTHGGEIIDPTATQFVSKGIGVYDEHIGEEPTGRCCNCGAYCYYGRSFCCDVCADDTKKFMNNNEVSCRLKLT